VGAVLFVAPCLGGATWFYPPHLSNLPCDAQEVALVGMLSYLSYLLAEVGGLSGILSLFCCGIVVSHFALPNT